MDFSKINIFFAKTFGKTKGGFCPLLFLIHSKISKSLLQSRKNMELQEKIVQAVESMLEAGYFLVDVQIKQLKEKKKITVFLDGDQGISIDVCARVSKSLSNYLEQFDWIDTPYVLEVSSPGVDNPLKLPRQYPQHIGRSLQVKDKNQNLYEGTLIEVKEDSILIEQTQGKGKKAIKTQKMFEFGDIASAKVLISFK